jgi:drug/metabolite transporter (DMT)-like permease
VAGIVLAFCSAGLYNTGMVLEKLASTRMPPVHVRRSIEMLRVLFGSALWDLGFVLLLAGLATQVVALSLAPISLVQVVLASGIVLLLVLSHLFLGDRLGRRDSLGIGAIGIALVLLGLSVDSHADHANASGSLAALLAAAVPAAAAAGVLFLAAERLDGASQRRTRLRTPLFATASGLLYGVAALAVKSVSTIVERRGVLAALPHVVASPALYLLVVSSAAGFVIFQTALPRSLASVLVPVNTVVSSAYFIVVGTIVFHESLPRATAPLVLRVLAFAAIVAGLGALSLGREVGQAHVPPAAKQRSGSTA